MKKLIIFAMIFFVAPMASADEHKSETTFMNKQECNELKNGIAELLMVTDYYWKEIEKDNENKDLYEAVAFYSQQAAIIPLFTMYGAISFPLLTEDD